MILDVRGTTDPVAQVGEAQHGTQHLGAERRTNIGISRSAAAQDSAEVEHLDGVAHGDPFRHLSRVTAERPPCAERPSQEIAGPQ